ncbi:MAG TPA: hypothetical protein VFO89_05800 [Thermoanaerobaculia bacterium]|nr:hypothetical protein [Thermoanaerobaculia bacterium]
MQRDTVIQYVESLARGIDPTSGAPIPLETFRTTEVVRALFTAAQWLRSGEEAPPGDISSTSTARPIAAGARWTDEEDLRLAYEFDCGMPIRDIARLHGRTQGAITLRLVKLGRLQESAVPLRERGARLAS